MAAALGLLTVLLYWPATHYKFLDYDDDQYVTANTLVQRGLAADSLKFVLLNPVGGNWHPVTMLSHTLDCQWFGLNAGAHHRTSVLLHALNTVLVFVLFRRLTGAQWRSACVAALFGWHPLHVESVAWIAERKDVLSTAFGLLALLAYVRYVRENPAAPPPGNPAARPFYKSGWYWLAWVCFVLGLLSKPMLVTWPFVLLLLDFWPLGRFSAGRWKLLLVEKIPFFALAAAICVLTYAAQKSMGAMHALERVSLEMRCENALISCCRYLGKMVWPADLAVMYPYPKSWPIGWVLVAGLFLGGVTIFAWARRKRQPWFLMGWLWFLGTLAPVIGLVQVGVQAMADRYTYIPSLSVFMMAVWGAGGWAQFGQWRRWTVILGALAVLGACGAATRHQLEYWRDSVTLFQHALAVTDDNHVTRNNLGEGLAEEQKWAAAGEQFQAALRLKPDCVEAWDNLGRAMIQQGDTNGALADFRKVVELRPDFPMGRYHYGMALEQSGRADEAITQLREAVRLRPEYPPAHGDLGALLAARGQTKEAIAEYQVAIWLQSADNAEACFKLGNLYVKQGLKDDAMRLFVQAVRARPDFPEARNNLGSLLSSQGRLSEAIQQLHEAVRLKPDYVDARFDLGNALFKAGQLDEAAGQYQAAIKLAPDLAPAHTYLGIILARKGQTNEAIAQYRESARLRPDDALAHERLGSALLQAGQGEEALGQYQEALRLKPGFIEASNGLVRAQATRANPAAGVAQPGSR
jgi:tetratricopeptide (TPR) repeat protein